MALVVIIEPSGDLPEHCSSIQQWVDASVVALEGFSKIAGLQWRGSWKGFVYGPTVGWRPENRLANSWSI
jgi:hypothetical protein